MVPKGIILGEWKGSFHGRLEFGRKGNTIYGSRDVGNRIIRRIGKEDPDRNIVLGGRYISNSTIYKYEDVKLTREFEGLTKE